MHLQMAVEVVMVGDEMCCRILCYRDKLTADRGSCLRHGGPRWARSGLTCSGRLMRPAKYRQNARVGQIDVAWFYSAGKHEVWSCFLVFVSFNPMTEQPRNDVRNMRRCDCGMRTLTLSTRPGESATMRLIQPKHVDVHPL